MKPFSACYFIKHNKRRTIALIFMIAVTALCYVGGIYVTSPQYHCERLNRPYQDYAALYLDYPSTQEDYDAFSKTILSLPSVKSIVPFSSAGFIQHSNEMRIENSLQVIALTSEDDFQLFAQSIPELSSLERIPSDGELIISSSFAKNTGISLNDVLSKSNYSFTKPFQVIQIMESDDYFAYGVDSTATPYSALILRGGNRSEFATDLSSLPLRYQGIFLNTYQTLSEDAVSDLAVFHLIFFLCIALITCVLAITINAAFVGTYEKRSHEFAIYHALGFHRSTIAWKLIKEILLLDLIGMAIAIVFSLTVVSLLNKLLLYPLGLGLVYINTLSLTSMLACNGLVILLTLLLRIRWFHRLKPAV